MRGRVRGERVVQRESLVFDRMRAPFSVGYGQFVLHDAELRGPLLGATLRGKADFRRRTVNLGGTYVPLQGLNAALSAIPGIGQILTGPRGEGVLGMNFLVQGQMAEPEVVVHPLSMMAPGIFREMFQLGPQRSQVTAPDVITSGPVPRSSAARPSRGPASPQGGAGNRGAAGGWTSETRPFDTRR